MVDLVRYGLGAMLWRLYRSGRNALRKVVIEQPIRLFAIMLVIGVVWALIAGITVGVLRFLEQDQYVDLKLSLLRFIINLFFFSLFFLVSISNALVVWSALFKTKSAIFQAQLPLTNRALFWSAVCEGGAWASWAVLVLAVPLVGALASEATEPIPFFLSALAILLGFLICCIATGALGSIVLARVIPILRRGWKGFLIVGAGAVCVAIALLISSFDDSQQPQNFLRDIMGRVSFIENPYLPPMWAQRAMDAALISYWPGWGYFVLMLISTAIALGITAEYIAVRRLRIDLDLLCGRGSRRKSSYSKPWRLVSFLPADLGLLVAKDLRLFRRDPAQLMQFGLFFGMLAFYISLLPVIGKAFQDIPGWSKTVSMLNLTAVSMALSTFTGRFVYPLLSLEGKRLWVLILAPWERTRIVTAKFAFAMLVGVPISVVLVALSGTLLELDPSAIAYQAFTTICMGIGLAAAALGLGASMADYNEDNPAKLVAGYGGTINLLASLIYATLMLIGAGVPLMLRELGPWRWAAGIAWLVVICGIWTFAGLNMARRHFGRGA